MGHLWELGSPVGNGTPVGIGVTGGEYEGHLVASGASIPSQSCKDPVDPLPFLFFAFAVLIF